MTPAWEDIASELRSNNSHRLQSSIETPTGTGLTVQETALYTTITRLRFGIEKQTEGSELDSNVLILVNSLFRDASG